MIDNIFVVLFFFEMLLKMLVMGFVVGPDTYLRNAWNRLDFFIVLVGLFGMVRPFSISNSLFSSIQLSAPVERLRK